MTKTKNEKKQEKIKNVVGSRGRIFEGSVTKKFDKRIVVEAQKTKYAKKYESYFKQRQKLHARIPEGAKVNVGDYVRIQECRPLSKIINFVLIEIVRSKEGESESN